MALTVSRGAVNGRSAESAPDDSRTLAAIARSSAETAKAVKEIRNLIVLLILLSFAAALYIVCELSWH